MDYKIIELKNGTSVLVRRATDCGDHQVVLETIIKGVETDDYCDQTVDFGDNEELAKSYVRDFSEESAQKFYDKFLELGVTDDDSND